jgi:hypothetical protein
MSEANMDDAVAKWVEFCDALRTTGTEILHGADDADGVSQAEGLRYLTRLLRSGIEKFVEYSDPDDPVLANVYNDRLKWGLDNPDSLYAMCGLRDDAIYEIIGNVGTVNYFNFTSATMSTDAKYQIDAVLEGVDVATDADGNFRIMVGGPAQPQNWMALSPGVNSLMLRQTFADRTAEREMSFRIRRSDGAGALPKPTLDSAVARIDQAKTFFVRTSGTFAALGDRIKASVNALPLVDQKLMLSMGGDPNYVYFWGGFSIGGGEALLIHFTEVPETTTWSLCLYNHWLESLDHTRATINLNKQMAQHNADGSLTIVVSATDPGVPNWLNTLEHENGVMMSRWVNPTRVVQPQTSIARLDNIDWNSIHQRWPHTGATAP